MSSVPAIPVLAYARGRRPGAGFRPGAAAWSATFGAPWEPAAPAGSGPVGASQLPFALFLLTTVALSAALIPRGQELALLRLEAGDARRALTMLEQRYADGDRSAGAISALARARAGVGDVPGAIRLLEGLVRERPSDRRLLEGLAGYYRQAGRDRELLGTLGRLQGLWPAPARLREIARLQGGLGQQEAQLQSLRALVRQSEGEPADYRDLARLEGMLGDPAAGLGAVRHLAELFPEAVDTGLVALEMSLLVAAGDPQGAVLRGQHWLRGRPSGELAQAGLALAGVLYTARRSDLIVALLDQRATGEDAPPELVATMAQAESDMGNRVVALQRLERFATLRPEPQLDHALLRLRLAIALGELDRGVAAIEPFGLGRVPLGALASLAASALDAGRLDILGRIRAGGGEAFLTLDPALSAEMLLALGDEPAARLWSDRALASVAEHPFRAVRLAAVRLRLGQAEGVPELLERLLPAAAPHPALLGEIARLYIRMGQAEQGRVVLDALRRPGEASPADGAWALAATAAGQGAEVAAWFAAAGSAERQPFPGFLSDLMHLASDARAYPLAIAIAEHFAARRGTGADQVLLARFLVAAGRPREALAPLRLARPTGAVPEEFYLHALTLAWRQGEPVAGELRELWLRRLAEAAEPAARNAAISTLLDLGGHAELLPTLRQLALAEPDRWLWSHGEAARRAGRAGEAASLLAELATSPRTRPELRRQLAFRLLEGGNKPLAERAFLGLAATARPDSVEARQLLYLWGPRPGAERLGWLEARARRATGEERAAWMRALTERGGATRAVAVHRAATALGPVTEAERDAFLAALNGLRDRAGLATALREELRRPASAARLQRLADLAGATGDGAVEEQALRALVAAGGGGPRAQRQLGMAAYRSRDLATAERLLGEFDARTGGDFETHFIMGEIRQKQRDAAGARRHWQHAMLALDGGGAGARTAQARAVRAVVLQRLGYTREAKALYETLLAERPQDRNLRADYVALLLVEGDLRKAREVLGAR